MATGSAKRSKRGKRGKPDNPPQSARFIKGAKELGADESGKAFEEAMRALAKGTLAKRKPQ
jgi:hypothetical protein